MAKALVGRWSGLAGGFLLASVLLGVVGCDDDKPAATGPDGGDAGGGTCRDIDAGEDPADASIQRGPLNITGVVQNLELNKERQLYDGIPCVRVCVYPGHDICGTSDENGNYRIDGVPENSELILSYEHPDYVPTLRMLLTRENNVILLAPSIMGTVALARRLAEDYDFIAKPGHGSLQFFAMNPAMGVLQLQELEGFTVELHDLDGNVFTDHDDITYASADGVPDPRLEQSSRRGVGGIANIPPGNYELVFSHPTLDCTEKLEEAGWLTDTPRAARFRIVPEWVTGMVGIVCQRPE